jgi:hypothetical protein
MVVNLGDGGPGFLTLWRRCLFDVLHRRTSEDCDKILYRTFLPFSTLNGSNFKSVRSNFSVLRIRDPVFFDPCIFIFWSLYPDLDLVAKKLRSGTDLVKSSDPDPFTTWPDQYETF